MEQNEVNSIWSLQIDNLGAPVWNADDFMDLLALKVR